MVTWEQISMKHGMQGWRMKQKKRDKQRGIRDVTEMGQTWGWKRYSGGRWSGMDLLEIHQRSISNSTPSLKAKPMRLITWSWESTFKGWAIKGGKAQKAGRQVALHASHSKNLSHKRKTRVQQKCLPTIAPHYSSPMMSPPSTITMSLGCRSTWWQSRGSSKRRLSKSD